MFLLEIVVNFAILCCVIVMIYIYIYIIYIYVYIYTHIYIYVYITIRYSAEIGPGVFNWQVSFASVTKLQKLIETTLAAA